MKAMEWRIPVVNINWLNDLVLGHLDALKLPLHSRYQQLPLDDEFTIDSWRVAQLLGECMWKNPGPVSI